MSDLVLREVLPDGRIRLDFISFLKGDSMANSTLVDVAPSVSTREVEQFKLERIAENIFIVAMAEALAVLEGKVGPRNRVVGSMRRFLNGRR